MAHPSSVELLLECLRGDPEAAPVSALEQLSEAGWQELAEAAARHELEPLLHSRLQALAPRLAIPAETAQHLQVVYGCSALRNRAIYGGLAEVLAAFRAEAVPVVVLKGAYLADVVYGDVALRPMGDVDLLVRREYLADAGRLLLGLGYQPLTSESRVDYERHHHLRPFGRPGAVPIEIHRALAPPGAPFRIDLDGLWARAHAARVAGTEVLALGPEDLLLHLCLHVAYNHRFGVSLLQLCDLAATLRHFEERLDWERLAGIANADGRSRFACCTLALVQDVLGVTIPADALGRLQHAPADREIVGVIRDCILTPAVDLPVAYRQLTGRTGPGGRLRLLARGLFPPPERLRRVYELPEGSRRVYGYYLYRPLDLLLRRGRLTAEIVGRSPGLQPALERERKRQRVERWLEAEPPEMKPPAPPTLTAAAPPPPAGRSRG